MKFLVTIRYVFARIFWLFPYKTTFKYQFVTEKHINVSLVKNLSFQGDFNGLVF